MVDTASHTDELDRKKKKQGAIGEFQEDEVYVREKVIWQVQSHLRLIKSQVLQLTP